jgi:hypothetical protein
MYIHIWIVIINPTIAVPTLGSKLGYIYVYTYMYNYV